jgi:hypothetical protein
MEAIEWRDIRGYEGLYVVSNRGEVKRIGRKRGAVVGKVLRPGLASSGYLTVSLHGHTGCRTHCIHRLLSEAFIPNPDPTTKKEVNHIDGDKTNNSLSNLEWVTYKENLHHSYDVLGRQPSRGNAKLNEQSVREIRSLLQTTKLTQREIGDMFGVCNKAISQIKTKENWSHVI